MLARPLLHADRMRGLASAAAALGFLIGCGSQSTQSPGGDAGGCCDAGPPDGGVDAGAVDAGDGGDVGPGLPFGCLPGTQLLLPSSVSGYLNFAAIPDTQLDAGAALDITGALQDAGLHARRQRGEYAHRSGRERLQWRWHP